MINIVAMAAQCLYVLLIFDFHFFKVVFELFDAVSIDLSVHANVILKSLTTQLVSKEDSYRQFANRALVSMGKQMSDADAVQEVVKSLMGMLKGRHQVFEALLLMHVKKKWKKSSFNFKL